MVVSTMSVMASKSAGAAMAVWAPVVCVVECALVVKVPVAVVARRGSGCDGGLAAVVGAVEFALVV